MRLLQPQTVLETGGTPGKSPALILRALSRHEFGHLIRIDLPRETIVAAEALDVAKVPQPLPAGRDTGRIVPAALKARQTVCPGTSADWLGPAQQAASGAGKFIHDSDHWFENMLWEFETAQPSLRRGGLLCADD